MALPRGDMLLKLFVDAWLAQVAPWPKASQSQAQARARLLDHMD
jgi:hypothetical protein